MKKSNKRGFTIVELVIVIAVIAIFAAVLILTFSNGINKANQAKDTQLVRNLNTSLKLDVGVKHNTMQDALDAVAQQGYDLDKINASAMQDEILWDSHNDAFVYLDGEGNINYLPEIEKDRDATELELWRICKEMPTEQKYSIYAGNGWNTDNIDNLSVGFDAGKNTNITSVNYVNNGSAQSVVIRTNGGKLTVNDASTGSVSHYGESEYIDVIQCHTASYHEYGTVSFVNVKKGHVAFEKGSAVNGVHIEKSGSEVVGDKIYDKFDTIILSFDETVEQPEYSRDAVTINPEGTKVCTLDLPDETTNIYLFLNGIYEQIKIEKANVSGEGTSDKEWVSTSSKSNETKSAADQLANNFVGRETAIGHELTSEVIDNENRTFVNTNDEEKVVETGVTKETANVFASGIKAYSDMLADEITIDLFDFTRTAEEKGMTTEGKVVLPLQANLDVAYSFKAFEKQEDEELVMSLLEKLGISDDSQLVDLDLEAIENAINKQNYTKEEQERLHALIDVRKDYLMWNADFTISFDKDVVANSIALGGQYDSYSEAWLGFGLPFNIKANEEFRMLNTAYLATENDVFRMSYAAICTWVKEFNCGIGNLSKANIGTKATVTLKIYETDNEGNETGKSIDINSFSIVFTESQLTEE